MSIAAHFSAAIYGEVEGQPPFQNSAGATAFSRAKDWPTPGVVSLPTTGTIFYPLTNGVLIGSSGIYVYSVIEVQPTGLNIHGTKYVSNATVASLATLAG